MDVNNACWRSLVLLSVFLLFIKHCYKDRQRMCQTKSALMTEKRFLLARNIYVCSSESKFMTSFITLEVPGKRNKIYFYCSNAL